MSKPRSVVVGFVALTLVKMAAMVLLTRAGVTQPFIGANAEDHYLPTAERLLKEGRFNGPDSRPDSKVPVGYPALLAAVMWACPRYPLLAVVCIQIAADLVVALLLYGLGRWMGSPAAGALAGLLWLLYPPALAVATWITAETVFTALLLASMALLILTLRRQALGLAFAAGLVLGLATLVRGTCVYLPFFFLPLWLSRGWSRRLLIGVAFTLATACVVLPWTLRNWLVLGDPILVSVGSGSVFLSGSEEGLLTIQGRKEIYPAPFLAARQAGIRKPASDRESEIDHWLLRVGLYNYQVRWRERPWSFVTLAGFKLLYLWYGLESGAFYPEVMLAVIAVLVVPLGLWQVWRWRRDHPLLAWVFGLLILYFIGVHCVLMPEYRYVHPIYPVLFLAVSQVIVGWFGSRPATSATKERAA